MMMKRILVKQENILTGKLHRR